MINFFKKIKNVVLVALMLGVAVFSLGTIANKTLASSFHNITVTPGGGASSVTSPLSSLNVSPTTGAVQADVNLGHNFAWTGQHTFNTTLPTSIVTPVNANDLVTKQYTDTFALGLQIRASPITATAVALPANTYNNGVLGVGATLTANAPGILSVDGYAVLLNDRILIKNEAAQSHNGIYNVTTLGTVGVPYVLTRATDYDQTADVTVGTFVAVTRGTVNVNTQWVMDNNNTIVMGTTPITFSQLSTTNGNVIGTPPSVDNAISRYDGTTGLKIQNSDVTISDSIGSIVTMDSGNNAFYIQTNGVSDEFEVDSAGPINLNAGSNTGSGSGFSFNGRGGTGGPTGMGGIALVLGGQGGSTSGAGGRAIIGGGSSTFPATNSDGGDVWVVPGAKTGTGTKGKFRFYDTFGANWAAIFDASAIATSDKTFSFQNLTGTFAELENNLGSFASTTSAQLASVLSNETGTGLAVFNTSPTFVTPNLGTPSTLVGTNITGTAAGLTCGTVTTNANLTGPITSIGNATSIGAQTGAGSTFVMQSSPTLTTPNIGVATGTSLTTTGAITTSSTGGAGIGYTTAVGAGGAVTQLTSKSTAVILNKATGRITMNAASLANNASVSFTLTDSAIGATDVLVLNIQGGGTIGAYQATVSSVIAGSATLTLRNVSGGALAQAVVLQFADIKGSIN